MIGFIAGVFAASLLGAMPEGSNPAVRAIPNCGLSVVYELEPEEIERRMETLEQKYCAGPCYEGQWLQLEREVYCQLQRTRHLEQLALARGAPLPKSADRTSCTYYRAVLEVAVPPVDPSIITDASIDRYLIREIVSYTVALSWVASDGSANPEPAAAMTVTKRADVPPEVWFALTALSHPCPISISVADPSGGTWALNQLRCNSENINDLEARRTARQTLANVATKMRRLDAEGRQQRTFDLPPNMAGAPGEASQSSSAPPSRRASELSLCEEAEW